MRVLIGAIGHESNTFTPFLTRRADFFVRYGSDIWQQTEPGSALAGIIATLQAHSVELVPSVAASALPGGVVERRAYEEFKHAVLDAAHDVDGVQCPFANAVVRALDGVCLFLHGAMRAEGVDYCENDLLRDLRAQLGLAVPITIALDMHANIVAEMVRSVNALVAYHTAPHDDAFETGARAAQMLLRILGEGIQTRIGFAKLPFLLPGEMAQTAREPMAALMRLVAEIEQHPDVLSASLMNGHCWADVPDVGVAAVVVTTGNAALAQTEANRLAAACWARRAEFGLSAEAYPVEEAIEQALAAAESPVFLSDSGDNPGAGGTTDVPVVLEQLLTRRATNVLVAGIWDAAAVEACRAAGVGQEVTLTVGGKLDKRHGPPVRVTGRVRLLADGDAYQGGTRRPPGREKAGPIAVLNVSGVDVILSSHRLSFEDPIQLRRLGLEPLDYRLVVLKRGYLTTPFQVISPRTILALSPGATNCDVTQMKFRRVSRPIYPLDPEMTWTPG